MFQLSLSFFHLALDVHLYARLTKFVIALQCDNILDWIIDHADRTCYGSFHYAQLSFKINRWLSPVYLQRK